MFTDFFLALLCLLFFFFSVQDGEPLSFFSIFSQKRGSGDRIEQSNLQIKIGQHSRKGLIRPSDPNIPYLLKKGKKKGEVQLYCL